MSRWKIFFSDGTTFSSDEGGVLSVPVKTVAVIIQEDGRWGRRILKLQDWYRWDPEADRWFDCTEFDVKLQLVRQGTVTARIGQYLPEREFEKILITAHEDTFIEAICPGEPSHPAWRK